MKGAVYSIPTSFETADVHDDVEIFEVLTAMKMTTTARTSNLTAKLYLQ
jgi:hypothetical protein